MDVVNSRGDTTKISELIPFVESIMWGCQKLNVKCEKFSKFIYVSFGVQATSELSKYTKVILDIHNCFA